MTNSHRAVFLDHPSLDLGDLDLSPLRACFSELQLFAQTTPDQVIERLKGATVAISNKILIDADAIAASPELKLILITATGTNNVDLVAARAHGITVCNCQGYGTPSVAQHTIMLLLNLATRLADYQKAVGEGRWQQAKQFCLLDYPIVELEGKTLGLLGHGELGGAVARLAEAFGMRVLLGQIPGRPARPDRLPLDELLPQIDALTLHCPLNEHTRHFIGARATGVDETRRLRDQHRSRWPDRRTGLGRRLAQRSSGRRGHRRAERRATDGWQPAVGP